MEPLECYGVLQVRRMMMRRKLITVALMGATLALSACNRVRGAAADVKSVADCTQDMMNRGEC